MASAFWDPRARRWVASFRGLFDPRRRRLLVPVDQVPPGDGPTAKAAADAFASECDSLVQRCACSPGLDTIARAEALGAILPAQAIALRTGTAPPLAGDQRKREAVTILAAARMHPSSHRETVDEAKRHTAAVEAFTTWAGTVRVEDLTAERAMAYVAHLQASGYCYDGRRHALLWLRRAARMAGGLGYADALTGLVLDRRGDDRPAVEAWTFAELGQMVKAAARQDDQRLLAVVLLGGWCGLRDSEIYRLRCGDLDGEVLAVAKRKAKNRASRRDIPLPPTVAAVLADLAAGQPDTAPLIRPGSQRTKRTRSDGAFCDHTFPRWFGRAVWGDRPATPRALAAALVEDPVQPRPDRQLPGSSRLGCLPALRRLPPKCLRKTFLSWAFRQGLNRDQAERYAGHTLSGALPVSERHYLADLLVAELRPLAVELEARLVKVYRHPSMDSQVAVAQ
jgi:integrase